MDLVYQKINQAALSTILLLFLFMSFGCKKRHVTPPSLSYDEPFSLVIISDPQLYWYNRPDGACSDTVTSVPSGTCAIVPGESYSDCVTRCGTESNIDQLNSINQAHRLIWPDSGIIQVNQGGRIHDIAAAIANGDLTAFWHPNEKTAYMDFFQENEDSLPDFPLYAGLGNHDYSNNVCDCQGYWPWTTNSCARDAVQTLEDIYSNQEGINFDSCSKSYSINIGKYHIVQLNLNPSYSVDLNNNKTGCEPNTYNVECDGKNKIGTAFDWLSTDLFWPTLSRQYTILNMHAAGDSSNFWGNDSSKISENKQKFKNLIANSHTIAVFGGHIHRKHGYMGEYILEGDTVKNAWGDSIPWFRSGASEYYTYLVAEFGLDASNNRYMNVGVVSSSANSTRFINSNEVDIGPSTFWLR